jgi:hypothetical protein
MNRIFILLLPLLLITPTVLAASAQKNLYQAAEQGNERAIRNALKSGADVDKQDKDGWTALIFAATQGHEIAVDLLLKEGADPNIAANKGETALLGAVMTGKTTIVRSLLQAGANPMARLDSGQNALDLANQYQFRGIIALLERKGIVSKSTETTESSKTQDFNDKTRKLKIFLEKTTSYITDHIVHQYGLDIVDYCIINIQQRKFDPEYGSNYYSSPNSAVYQILIPINKININNYRVDDLTTIFQNKRPGPGNNMKTVQPSFYTYGNDIVSQGVGNGRVFNEGSYSNGFSIQFDVKEKADEFAELFLDLSKSCGAQ